VLVWLVLVWLVLVWLVLVWLVWWWCCVFAWVAWVSCTEPPAGVSGRLNSRERGIGFVREVEYA
jgi:hypothetical protein